MSVELKHWLQSINLDHYLSDFRKAGYTTLEQCEHLSDESLNEIGITLPGHRRRVLAHLPKKEDFKPVEDEHLYGNLPTPSSPPECSAPKPKPPHTYVNAPTTPSSDAVYSNVAFPQPAPVQETPCSPEAHGGSRSTLAGRDGSTVFDDSESFYDVLPPPTACKVLADDADGGEYVNIALSSSLEGAVGGVDLPPALPPKKNKVHRRSLDDAMVMSSVSTPPEGTPKRPVPKPRTTVRSGGGRTPSSDGAGADESPRNSALSHALFDVKKKPSPPMLKPIPKPRPRPSARGTKSQDSGSSNSSASGSPRLSPVPRVPSPNMPTELAPSPPIHAASPPTHAPVHTHAASPATSTPSLTHGPSPQTHSPSVPLHGPSPPKPPRQKLKASPSVPIPAVPVKQHEPAVDPLPPPPPPKMTPAKAEEAPPPPRDERPPAVEPMLSLETEVPPAEDAEPCDLAQVKIPLPKCPHHHGEQNHHQSNSAAADSNATFWRVDSPHTYENTKIQTEQKYQDPDEPEKLDDFIKSLMSTSAEPAQHSVPDLLEKPDPPTLVDNLLLPGLPEKRPETDVSETAGNQLNDKPILPDKASVGAKEQTPASNSGSNEVQEDLYQIPLPVIALMKPNGQSDPKPRPDTGSAAALDSTASLGVDMVTTSSESLEQEGQMAGTSGVSTFTTGWSKAPGQPGDVQTRSVAGRDGATAAADHLSAVSESSESSIDREKHDSAYGAVWFASTGGAEPCADVYEDINDPGANSDSRPLHLSLKRNEQLETNSIIAESISSNRDSVVSSASFNVPEPTFTPPPLPPGTPMESFTRAAIAKATSQTRPPPVVPPRARGVSPRAAGASEMGSSSSLASTQSQSSGSSVGALLHTEPVVDHRFSSTSFSDLAMQRVESARRGAAEAAAAWAAALEEDERRLEETPPDDKYEEIACPRSKPPRPRLATSMSPHTERMSSCQNAPESRSVCSLAASDDVSHIYSPEPVNAGPGAAAAARCPPAPPPRNSQPPFANLLNYSGASAFFNDDLSDTTSTGSVWESDDDALSDGGEYYDSNTLKHQKPTNLLECIPVVPFAPTTSLAEKKGTCFKYGTMQSRRRGWQKRWVHFDGKSLRYFRDEKSPVSKRVIPVSSMVNVEQDIKHGETHGYGFRLITVDRVYTFAVEDADELSLWTCLLMKAIIDCEERFVEGGDMSDPDLEGFVRMEGVKGKRYLAVKRDVMAYYNTYNDFKAGTPIHIVEMKVASVRAVAKNKLDLTTPYASYGLSYDSNEELVNWKNALEESITEGLAENAVMLEIYENHSNRFCADCGAPDPHWASINLGITICKHCAGVHRNLTMPFSKVRSLRMDVKVWTPTLKQLLQVIGNDNANKFWEWNSSEDDRIDSDVDVNERRDYIVSKYEEKMFCRLHPLHNDESAMNDALCKSVQYSDVFETMQLVFSGADIQCTTSEYGEEHETPSQLARRAKQTEQMEFLYQNGAEGSGKFPTSTSMSFKNSSSRANSDAAKGLNLVKIRGTLLKTGPNQKDFHKRWCILEHGILTYFENERALVAKDSILRSEMMSVSKVKDERQEFAFELGTTKAGGRVYLFAAETHDDRQKWLVKLAKAFAPLPVSDLQHIRDLDRAGMVYLREGATTDWQMTWIQLKERCFSVFNKESKVFEEIDLRKIIGIKTLSETEQDDMFQDKSPPFVLDLHKRAIYIKGDCARETKAWFKLLEKIASESGGYLIEQQLTVDEVPVIVDKCINFVSTHGLKMEGVYRKNGIHSKVTQLCQLFRANARDVHLRLDDYEVHDIATTLKRFFRSLEEPLLTSFLYAKWTNTCNISDYGAKMQWYKYLLGELPTVHYSTLKRVVLHLARVTEFQDDNKMTKINLASIFGPVLMNQEKGDIGEHNTTTGFGATQQEISVILDLLDNNRWLFEVNDEELKKEEEMQIALEKIQKANEFRQAQAGELLMGVYIHDKDGDAVTLKIPPNMTGEDLLEYVVGKAMLDRDVFWGVFEIVGHGQMERPLHFLEKVLDVTLRWTEWPEDFCRDNYLVVKENYVYSHVDNVFDPHCSLFEELKYSEKKSFKKYCFEFSQYKLTYQKDPRATSSKNSWNVEDLIVYLGVDQKRNPPSRHGLTFIATKEKVAKNKETPHFGHCLVFATQEDQYRWLAAMLHAQHPGGLTRHGTPVATGAHGSDSEAPRPPMTERPQSPWSRAKSKSSFISRLMKR